MQRQQTQNSFPGPKSYRDFRETGPWFVRLGYYRAFTHRLQLIKKSPLGYKVFWHLRFQIKNLWTLDQTGTCFCVSKRKTNPVPKCRIRPDFGKISGKITLAKVTCRRFARVCLMTGCCNKSWSDCSLRRGWSSGTHSSSCRESYFYIKHNSEDLWSAEGSSGCCVQDWIFCCTRLYSPICWRNGFRTSSKQQC